MTKSRHERDERWNAKRRKRHFAIFEDGRTACKKLLESVGRWSTRPSEIECEPCRRYLRKVLS